MVFFQLNLRACSSIGRARLWHSRGKGIVAPQVHQLMTKNKKSINLKSFWQFVLVNNKLAEVHFNKGKILGYCYVEAKDYKTKQEKKWIAKDMKVLDLSYRNGKYRNKIDGEFIKAVTRKDLY